MIIETRVKQSKAMNIRDKLKLKGKYEDNYNKHSNGRIWIFCDDSRVEFRFVSSTQMLIHGGSL